MLCHGMYNCIVKAAVTESGLVEIIMATGRQATLKYFFSPLEQSSSKPKLTVDKSFNESDTEKEPM